MISQGVKVIRDIFSHFKRSIFLPSVLRVDISPKMSRGRYFPNPYPDFDPATKDTFPLEWSEKVEALKNDIVTMSQLVFKKSEGKNCDGGIYVGPAGIAYMYFHISRNPIVLSPDAKTLFQACALKELQYHLKYLDTHKTSTSDAPGFLLGHAGVNAVGAVLGKLAGDEQLCRKFLDDYAAAAPICQPLNFRAGGSDELFVGRAGYLCGALWLQNFLGVQPVSTENLRKIWCAIIESGQSYSKQTRSPFPLMYAYYQTEYLGAAHGLCAIFQILLSFPEFLQEFPNSQRLIKDSIDFYLTLQDQKGNFPCAMDEVGPGKARSESDELIHWCHGAPGAIYMFGKAFKLFKEQKYLDVCLKCGDVIWERGLLKKGPGLCHGIAGNGCVFLLLHNLTGGTDLKHLYRASKFYEFLSTNEFKNNARTPDCPYSLYEGWAGTVCFMADLLEPSRAAFPFFEI